MLNEGGNESCQLLGPVSLFIQLLMGAAAISGLLIKRIYEHPKRTWIVWFYDVSKQVLGSLGIHFLNLLISILQAKKPTLHAFESGHGGDDSGDECDWYFLNLLMDTTVGIPILWFWLTAIQRILAWFQVKNIESGNYFPDIDDEHDWEASEPRSHKQPTFDAFLKQLLIFMTGLSLMKGCIYIILNYFEEFADWFADLVLGWSNPWPNFQVFLVMFIFPVALNCFQYFCIDSIIKLSADHLSTSNMDNFEQDSIVEHDEARVANNTQNKQVYGSI